MNICYCHIEECEFERDLHTVYVRDPDGAILLTLSANQTDREVRTVLGKMNSAYEHGLRMGRLQKAQEIQNALDPDKEVDQ